MHRQEVTFVVSPGHRAYNLGIKVVEATEGSACPTCRQAVSGYDSAKRQGREFMVMIMARAHGGFWDGLRECMRERGTIL